MCYLCAMKMLYRWCATSPSVSLSLHLISSQCSVYHAYSILQLAFSTVRNRKLYHNPMEMSAKFRKLFHHTTVKSSTWWSHCWINQLNDLFSIGSWYSFIKLMYSTLVPSLSISLSLCDSTRDVQSNHIAENICTTNWSSISRHGKRPN